MYTCMWNWVSMLYIRKLTEHCKPAIMEKNKILLSHKKEQNHAICSNMYGTRVSHTEWNKSERERQIPYAITDNWNLIYGTNETFYRKQNLIHGEQTCGCQEGGEWDGLGIWG